MLYNLNNLPSLYLVVYLLYFCEFFLKFRYRFFSVFQRRESTEFYLKNTLLIIVIIDIILYCLYMGLLLFIPVLPGIKGKTGSSTDTTQLDKLLNGRLIDLPNFVQKTIRVFLSSTFSGLYAQHFLLIYLLESDNINFT